MTLILLLRLKNTKRREFLWVNRMFTLKLTDPKYKTQVAILFQRKLNYEDAECQYIDCLWGGWSQFIML